MEDIQAILGAVALMIVSLAVILALIIFVLVEARWAIRLWVELYRRWERSIHELRGADASRDGPTGRRDGL